MWVHLIFTEFSNEVISDINRGLELAQLSAFLGSNLTKIEKNEVFDFNIMHRYINRQVLLVINKKQDDSSQNLHNVTKVKTTTYSYVNWKKFSGQFSQEFDKVRKNNPINVLSNTRSFSSTTPSKKNTLELDIITKSLSGKERQFNIWMDFKMALVNTNYFIEQIIQHSLFSYNVKYSVLTKVEKF